MPLVKYLEQRPRPELAPFVECLWMAWDEAARGEREPQRILPDGCPGLIVHLGDPFSRWRGTRWRVQPRAFLAGTLSRPWRLRGGRRVRTFGVRFRPGATPHVLPVRMDRATDRETALTSLVGRSRSTHLVARLQAARDTKACFAAAEAWLIEGQTGRPRPGEERRSPDHSRRAVGAILETRRQIRIGEVAQRCTATARQLERAFARDLGIRPKLFARIVRLNAFLERLGEAQRDRMVDLALDAGYYDQAHLLRDFRFLTGRRPARASESDGDLARHFTLPARLRALLAFD